MPSGVVDWQIVAHWKAQGVDQGVKKTKAGLEGVDRTSRKLIGTLGALAAAAGAAGLAKNIITTAAEFERLRVSLQTVTGSAANAEKAFESIKKFAADTPFQVQNITQAFTQLAALGLNPSMDLMRSFGDTAAAFGRDITEFASAAARAAYGEAEALKAFGIIVKYENEKARIQYGDTTKVVNRNAKDIIAALKEIGDTKYLGGANRLTDTLVGKISNLKDAWANFADEVGKAGVLDLLTTALTKVIPVVQELGERVKKLPEAWQGVKVIWINLWTDIKVATIKAIDDILTGMEGLVQFAAKWERASNKFNPFGDRTDWQGLESTIENTHEDLKQMIEDTNDLRNQKLDEVFRDSAAEARELADAADDVSTSLGNAGGAAKSIKELLAGQKLINAQLALDLELGQTIQDSMDEAFREVDWEQLSRDVENVFESAAVAMQTQWQNGDVFPVGGPPQGGVELDMSGTETAINALGSALDSTAARIANLVVSFVKLVRGMDDTEFSAGDLISIIIQLAITLHEWRVRAGREQRELRKQIRRDYINTTQDLVAATSEYASVIQDIDKRYNDIVKNLEDMLRITKEVNDGTRQKLEYELKLAEELREKEKARAILQLRQDAFGGLVSLLEQLSLYVDDERIAQDLAQLRLEMEIQGMRLQLEMLKQMGVIAQETLIWIEGMIDTVEAGLRSGEFEVGGVQGGPKFGGGRSPRRGGGTDPRETLAGLLDNLISLAGIAADDFGEIESKVAETLEHIHKMKLSEEERAMLVQQTLDLQRAAHEELGLTLLEKVYQATGNERQLQELESIRFEMERVHMLSQIDLLLTASDLSDEMRQRLEDGREALASFQLPTGSGTVRTADAWDQIMETLTGTRADELAARWDEWWEAAYDAAMAGHLAQDELLRGWELMRQQTKLSALDLIDAAAQFSGNEELAAKSAEKRFQIEKAIMLAEIQSMKALLMTLDGMEEYITLLDEAAQSVMDTVYTPPDLRVEITDPVVTAIDDQTDELADALRGLEDTMWDLLLGDQSTLNAEQKYKQALETYQGLVNKARSGDVEAVKELQNFAPQFLRILQDYSGGVNTSLYASGFAQVIADLAAIVGVDNPLSGLADPVGGVGFGGGNASNVIGSFQSFNAENSPIVRTGRDHMEQAHQDAENIRDELEQVHRRINQLATAIEDANESVA